MPGLPMPPVGNDRTFVGHHRIAFHVDGRCLVRVRQIVQLIGEVNRQCADRAADVIIFLEFEAEHRAVVLHRRFGFDLLGASMAAGHHVLGAILDPFNRPAGFHRQQRHQYDVFADQMNFLAEAAADIGDDHADILQSKRFAQAVVDHLRHLRGHPDGQVVCSPRRRRQ